MRFYLVILVLITPSLLSAQHWSMLKSHPLDTISITHGAHNNHSIIIQGSIKNALSLDGVNIVGYPNSINGFVAKLDYNGSLLWHKVFYSNTECKFTHSFIDNHGSIFLGGYFNGEVVIGNDTLLSSGGRDGIVIKTDSNGIITWYKKVGTLHHDAVTGVAVDSFFNLHVIASYGMYQGANDILTIDNFSVTSFGYADIGYFKLDQNGNCTELMSIGGGEIDNGRNIILDLNQNLYISGSVGSTVSTFNNLILSNQNYIVSTFISKLDTSGTFSWVRGGGYTQNFGTLGIGRIAIDHSLNIYGVGTFTADQIRFDNKVLNQTINDDVFVLKYDKDGTIKWLRKGGYYGGQNNGTLITVDKEYRVWVFGKASGAFTFGGGGDTLFTNGTSIFVWQFDTLGYEQQLYSVGLSSNAPTGISQSPNGDILLSGYAQNTTLTFGNLTANVGNQPTLYLARLSPGWPLSSESVGSTSKDKPEVYPNPASQQVSVALPKYNGYTRVFVYDMQGRQVYGVSTQKQQAHFPVISWPRGTYIVKVTQGQKVISKLLIVE